MSNTLKARLAAKPARGKGARQPILKLPSVMPNGARIKRHPLTYCIEQWLEARGAEGNKSDISRALGIKPQSLYKWEKACKQDRNFPLPILRARQLADFFRVRPDLFRPDFPWSMN